MVTLEAFAQRTPVIVRDLGGLAETVEDSGGGFTYRTDDELFAALEALRTDPALRSRLGDLGHAALEERWSEEPHLEAYLSAIADVEAGRITNEEPVRLLEAVR